MEISTSLFLGQRGPREEHLARIRAAGFTHVNPSAGEEEGRRSIYCRDEAEALREALARHDLQVDWLHLPFRTLQFCSRCGETRHVALAATLHGVRTAALFGARYAIVHPIHKDLPAGVSAEEARSRLTEVYAELLACGEREGVGVATENLPDAPSHDLNEHLLQTLPALGFCLDTGHCEITGTWDRFLRYTDRVVATHMQDTWGTDDDHLVPGDGVIDWQRVAAALHRAEYAGVWGCEALPRAGRYGHLRPDELLASTWERMRVIAEGRVPAPLLQPGPAGA